MFIDTHCHLTENYITGDPDGILERARAVGVGAVICPTADAKDIPQAIKIIKTFANVFATVGIHPQNTGTNPNLYLTDEILNNPKVVGVGEIGLDYHTGDENRGEQIKLFTQQLEIAKKHMLPVAIHTRNAEADTIGILTGDFRGVMHCFTSSWNLAKIMLDRGFFFSASGILTFKNSEDLRGVFAKIPLDRLVIETDSPYCAPVPFRGRPCEPAFVVETAKVLTQIKNLPLDKLETILEQNTKNLYPKFKLPS